MGFTVGLDFDGLRLFVRDAVLGVRGLIGEIVVRMDEANV